MIETQNLGKAYGDGFYALRNLTVTIDKGEFVFLTGASGAGKSTLLKLLLLQERPTEGDVVVAGRNLARLSPHDVQAYRRSVGFVFQDFKLIATKTVFENVAFALRVLGIPIDQQRRRTYQALKWVGLQHRLQAFPPELSGGEQQRIAIARALVNDPQLVLADEPTGNLDPDSSIEIMKLFREINTPGRRCWSPPTTRSSSGSSDAAFTSTTAGLTRRGPAVSMLAYGFQEALASLVRGGRGAIMSMGTIAIAFLALGGFLLITSNLQQVAQLWMDSAEVSVFLRDDISGDAGSHRTRLQQDSAALRVDYVTKEEAVERFRGDFPELADVTLGTQSLPRLVRGSPPTRFARRR